jgi:3-phosphoshikimate 1-carboxyvinyltransferase
LSNVEIKYRGPLKGTLETPPDKSISHRAVILSSLAEGKSRIKNFLIAHDPLATVNAFKALGIDIDIRGSDITIMGKGLKGLKEPYDIIDCGNSGTTCRLLSGVLAAQPFLSILTGDNSLKKRPMNRIISPLTQFGTTILARDRGYLPLAIRGNTNIVGICYHSPIASAQVKSAVLFSGLLAQGRTEIIEPAQSRDHTERMLQAAGAHIHTEGLKSVIEGGYNLSPLDITIPGDYSSAAFFIVAALIIPGSEILITNVGINSTRTGLLDVIRKMGAHVHIERKRDISGEPVADIVVSHSELTGCEIDNALVLRAIDEFPIICVAASRAQGKTIITGASELRVKESDRIASMALALQTLGVPVQELPDGIIIEGVENLKAGHIDSHEDHRVAMSMIVAALSAQDISVIKNTECIKTSFPDFLGLIDKITCQQNLKQ